MYVTNTNELKSALNYLKTCSVLGFDTETTGLDPLVDRVLLIQLGNTQKQYTFDVFQLGSKNIYTLLEWLKPKEILKIAHNAKFDYSMIKANFDVELENVACTMIGSQLLSMGRKWRHNLELLLKKFLNVYIDKTEQKSFIGHKWGDPFTEEQIKYAGEDVEHLIPLYDILTKKHIDRDMKDLATLEYEVVRVSGDMELNGIFINKDKWLFLQKEALVRADSAFKDLNAYFKKVCETDLFGDPVINYGSPLQVRPALEKILGKEIAGTGAAILKSLRSPATDALLKYREATKKVSTYGEAFLEKHIHPSDLRIHARFAQLGAGTGRFAGRTPNLMNIPKEKEYRAAFTAQYPDYRIIAADFSGQDNEIFYLFSA